MKMQDIIASIIDLIGQPQEQEPEVVLVAQPEEKPGSESPFTHTGDDSNRFRQIIDLIDNNDSPDGFSNEPNEKYADIEAVTTHAGGGLNGPKHPHDIRVKDPSAYPNQQEC